jgi:hypothetical protein
VKCVSWLVLQGFLSFEPQIAGRPAVSSSSSPFLTKCATKPPTVKRKPRPRVRVVRTERDLRIPPEILESHLRQFLDSLSEFTETCKDDKDIWISRSESEYDLPELRYRVTKWTGDIHEVKGLEVDRVSCGNVMERQEIGVDL